MSNNRKDFPTKEEIQQMTLPELNDFESELEQTISKIRVDLDFVGGSDEWYSRARTALSYHITALNRVHQSIKRITKGIPNNVYENQLLAKAKKLEAKAHNKQAVADQMKAKVEKKTIDLQNRKIDLIQNTSCLSYFRKAANKILEPHLIKQICDLADELTIENIDKKVNNVES